MRKKLNSLFKIFNQLYVILEPKHRKKMPRLFLCIFITSIFELLGVTSILPFVYALIAPEVIMENQYMKPVLEFLNIEDPINVLLFLGVAIVVIYIIKNLSLILFVWYQSSFSSRIQKELTIKMLHSYLSRPYQFFLDATLGELSRACKQDIEAVYLSIQSSFNLIMSVVTVVLIGAYMLLTDPIISIGTLGIALVMVFVITKLIRPFMKQLSKKAIVAVRNQNDAFNQTIQGAKELYVMGRKDLFEEVYDDACEEYRKVSVKYNVVDALPNRIIESFFIAGFIGVVLFRLNLGGEPASYVPKLASFAVGAFKVLPYISGITNKINTLVYQKSFVEDAYNNLKAAEDYQKEYAEYVKRVGGDRLQEEDGKKIEFNSVVDVKDVCWRYAENTAPVLTDANISICKGEAIGFVGKSGAGKTTLSDIMLGLLRPEHGSVYMDGKDIFAIPQTWSKTVGHVPQSVFLMAGTIRENIAFGLKDISDEEIWEALDKAQMQEFVRNLPEGLDTYVGERGVKLSGGQRQRIAIARALANKPDILFLDEATSALDNETERAIMDSIESLHGKMTMIIVAHRLTTIKKCDRIYKIEDGVATEVSKEEVFAE